MLASLLGSPQNLRALLAAAKTVDLQGRSHGRPRVVEPFVTISREPGAGDLELARAVLSVLNETEKADPPWTGWDRELVEKVAADHHLSKEVVESLEQTHRSWLAELFEGFSTADRPGLADRDAVYRHVANTVTSLAQMGRCIIIGAGSVLLTQRMPGGIHIRLVASPEYRLQRLAEQLHLPPDKAARRLRELESIRDDLFRRYFPRQPLRPDHFTLTINTERVPIETAAQMVVKLIHEAQRRH